MWLPTLACRLPLKPVLPCRSSLALAAPPEWTAMATAASAPPAAYTGSEPLLDENPDRLVTLENDDFEPWMSAI